MLSPASRDVTLRTILDRLMEVHWPEKIDGVRVPYGRSVAELDSLAKAGGAERWVAMVALAHSWDPRALDSLAELASSPNPFIRRFAIEWVGKHPDGVKLRQLLVDRLGDPDVCVVRTAAEVAGELRLREAHAAVIGLLRADAPHSREVGLRTLVTLWQESDFEPVLAAFARDDSPEVRRTAGWTLYRTRASSRAEVLFDLWRFNPLPRHRQWACEVAEEFPRARFRDEIILLAADSNGHVRKAARRALEAIDRAG